LADGSDIAMFDVEVVDANGIRCPNEESTVTFTAQGAATFLGGYNSGIQASLFKNDLKVEAGINRVFARATRTAGDFTLSVAKDGLTSASVTLKSTAVTLTDGLTDDPRYPQGYPPPPVR
jgi:beta-galactosidase